MQYSTEALFQPLISEGLFVFVDANFGNDTTGRPNNRSRPFKTIAAAITMVKRVSGGVYTLIINPGKYVETSNILWNCNYFFQPGAVVENGATTPLFADSVSTTGIVANIAGNGTFQSRSKIINSNGVISKQTFGTIFAITNVRSRIVWINQDINSLDVEAFIINDCEDFKIYTYSSINLDGNTFGFRVNGKNVHIQAISISGNCTGFQWQVNSGGIICKDFKLLFAAGSIGDYSTTVVTDIAGCSYFNAQVFQVLSLVTTCTKGDNRSYMSDATISTFFNISTLYNLNYNPSLMYTFDRLKTNDILIRGRNGSLTVQVNLQFDGTTGYNGSAEVVPGNSTLIVEGCNQAQTNATVSVQMTKAICATAYFGRNATDLTHQSGLIAVNIGQLQCNSFYAGMLNYSGLQRFNPRVNLSGLTWSGRGYMCAKTGGVLDYAVGETRETVTDGGVLTIQDFDTTPSVNGGLINIHDCLIKNQKTTQATTAVVLTAIHVPTANTQAIISVISSILSIGLPQNDTNLVDPNVRTLEPIYLVDNCINPPLLSVNSYKQITARTPSNPSPDPTLWSGSNLYDTRYVLL